MPQHFPCKPGQEQKHQLRDKVIHYKKYNFETIKRVSLATSVDGNATVFGLFGHTACIFLLLNTQISMNALESG
jgi:hypothetical protein